MWYAAPEVLPMSDLILASTSPARRALMDALGVRYRAEPPGVDEAVAEGTSAEAAVAELALRKARAVLARHPGALVLGADQLGWFEGRRLGKPADRAAAREQLGAMAGKTHALYTGVCLVGPGLEKIHVDVARITLYPLAPDELQRYLDLGEWEGCAGSYRVEGRGQALMRAIEGDRTGIQGLPMPAVVRFLREAGVRLF
jgi:septum formation protein